MTCVRPDHPPWRVNGITVPIAEVPSLERAGWTVVDDLSELTGCGDVVMMKPPTSIAEGAPS